MADRSVPADLTMGASPRPYTPLYGPDMVTIAPAPLDTELWLAQDFLGRAASANIHSTAAMIETAAGLYYRLAALVAAVDTERSVG